jgi:hypothetical protein
MREEQRAAGADADIELDSKIRVAVEVMIARGFDDCSARR